jgi:two-component system chemotaxis sensor kinase CheA
MIQIGSVFSRFNRVVRDVAKELGKDINLSINGSETELDKTLVERITDPLTHLVRNAIDHGIESQEERIKAGKSAVGEVSLNAYHDSGSIVIEVSDDGGGLNRDKIHQKAVERGLLTGSESLSDQDIFNLIFEPGFTTASAVTNLSGRGVGMDVVKRNITALRGTIDLQSRENEGIKVVLRLPLTLAIIDGFLVTVNEDKYVIPLDMVVECVDLRRVEFQATAQRNYVNLRGRVLPFVRLRELFGCAAPSVDKENLVVCEYAGQRAGIVVDGLLGEYQTVIKPLSQMFSKLEGIGGSTILGSGEVALILDIPAAVRAAIRNHTGDIETQVSTCTT